jgi:hypothetical protein
VSPARDYEAAFKDLITRLMEDDRFTLEHFNVHLGAPREVYARIAHQSGFALSSALVAFYEQCNGVEIRWSVSPEKIVQHWDPDEPKEVYGSINLLSLEKIFVGQDVENPWYNRLWYDSTPEEDKIELRRVRPFDWFNVNDLESVCFWVEEVEIAKELKYYRLDHGLLDFGMTFTQYLDFLLETGGLIEAREAVVFRDQRQDEEILHYLSHLFPGTDFSHRF